MEDFTYDELISLLVLVDMDIKRNRECIELNPESAIVPSLKKNIEHYNGIYRKLKLERDKRNRIWPQH